MIAAGTTDLGELRRAALERLLRGVISRRSRELIEWIVCRRIDESGDRIEARPIHPGLSAQGALEAIVGPLDALGVHAEGRRLTVATEHAGALVRALRDAHAST